MVSPIIRSHSCAGVRSSSGAGARHSLCAEPYGCRPICYRCFSARASRTNPQVQESVVLNKVQFAPVVLGLGSLAFVFHLAQDALSLRLHPHPTAKIMLQNLVSSVFRSSVPIACGSNGVFTAHRLGFSNGALIITWLARCEGMRLRHWLERRPDGARWLSKKVSEKIREAMHQLRASI